MSTAGTRPVVLWDGRVSAFGKWVNGTRTWGWRWAPVGLATRRQVSDMALRRGGQEPYGRIVCRRGRRWGWLYRVDLAVPKREVTPAVRAALAKAMAARRWCDTCSRDVGYCIPRVTLGSCADCWLGERPDISAPARDSLIPSPSPGAAKGTERARRGPVNGSDTGAGVDGGQARTRAHWETGCTHVFGPWGACACGFAIQDHTEHVPWFVIEGWCGVEFRACRRCPHVEERRDDECPTVSMVLDQADMEGAR